MKDFFKKTFTAGIIALLPIAGTLWLLKIIIYTAESMFEGLIPARFRPVNLIGYDIPGMGILAALILILLVGSITRFYIGKRLLTYSDQIFTKIPLGRGIYTAIKQFISTIAGGNQKSFRQVVLIEYPSPGIFALGFLTGWASGEVQEKTQRRVANVFIPTTPNPTSGFLLMFPEDKFKILEMTVEEAFKFIVSGGVVVKPFNNNGELIQPAGSD